MTVFSTTNSTALEILKGVAAHTTPEKQTPTVPRAGRPLEPASDASKQAAAIIAAIINETGGEVDLSGKQYSVAFIKGEDNATIIGGDGRDYVDVWDNATVITAGGDDSIGVQNNAKVDAGAGDDAISAYRNSQVTAGDGNDYVHTYSDSVIHAGAGDDRVKGGRRMQVDGGAGNDEIRTYDHSTIDAGEGDDIVVTYGNSIVKGGAGNDTIIATEKKSTFVFMGKDSYHLTFGHSDLDGGDGDDYIQTTDSSTVRGGTGNDMIRLIGGGSTVTFDKGDGRDVVTSRDDFTVKVGGYAKDDVTLTPQGDTLVVSFKGSDDSLTLNLSSGATARLAFEDGSTLDVEGTEKHVGLTVLRTSPDWGPTRDVAFIYGTDSIGERS